MIIVEESISKVLATREEELCWDEIVRRAHQFRKQGRQTVVVQGLGFVGAAVAAVLAGALGSDGQPLYFVIGVDQSSELGLQKVASINRGESPIVSVDKEMTSLIMRGVKKTGNLCATVKQEAFELADVIIINLPFSVVDRFIGKPDEIKVDLESFREAVHVIGRFMRPETLVFVETTVPTGVCEKVIVPVLRAERERRGLTEPLYLAHCYERVMPGPNYIRSIRDYWRSFAGIDDTSAQKARQFLSSFIKTSSYPLWEMKNVSSTEMAKLLENSYRAANIAFIHEWTLMAELIGVNLFEVVDSIRVRKGTHDNMMYPGFGVGGYCLTKDSLLAQWSLRNFFESNLVLEMTLKALEINNKMPLHTFDLLTDLINRPLKGLYVAVCGISYLPELADTRNSPVEILVDRIEQAGAAVIAHDPFVKIWPEKPNVQLAQSLGDCFNQADAVILTVPHRYYSQRDIETWFADFSRPLPIVDAWNILCDEKAHILHDRGFQLVGVGKGHWHRLGYHHQAKTA